MSSEDAIATGLLATLGIFAIFVVLLAIAFCVFAIVGNWKLFKKCGQDGWKAIIPYYNTYVLTEIAGCHWYWFLLSCAPAIIVFVGLNNNLSLTSICGLLSIVGQVGIYYNLSKKFKKPTSWFVLSIFFGEILVPILGYSSKEQYYKEEVVSEHSFLDKIINKDETTNTQNTSTSQSVQPSAPVQPSEPSTPVQPEVPSTPVETPTPAAPVQDNIEMPQVNSDNQNN